MAILLCVISISMCPPKGDSIRWKHIINQLLFITRRSAPSVSPGCDLNRGDSNQTTLLGEQHMAHLNSF